MRPDTTPSFIFRAAAGFIVATLMPGMVVAADSGDKQLEEVIVTSQRRAEAIEDVPISVTALSGERFDNLFDGGEDIRALATRVPSLYAESSNGRLAPRFYIRGLGNADFDLAASQPVSVLFDEVVQENVILKSFPLFDIERVETLRGPQGTLFGRNTPAGIVKFDTRKPSQEASGFFSGSYAFNGPATLSLQGAQGGPLSDTFSGRISFLYQDRMDWIDNKVPFPDPNNLAGPNAMGGFEEVAWRAQGLWEPNDQFSALVSLHGRDYNGTASIFRANVLGPGSDGFNANYDRSAVTYDEGDNNPQEATGLGGFARLEFDIDDRTTITSITAHEQLDDRSLGDIDGGYGFNDLRPAVGPCPPGWDPDDPDDSCIPFPSVTQDEIPNLDQFTQELRVSQQVTDNTFWQAGVYYFDSEFAVVTSPFFAPPTTVVHANEASAVFAHVSHDFSDTFTLTGGVRWTDDEKTLVAFNNPGAPVTPQKVSDDEISWDLSALFTINEDVNLYGRVARGFRAPTIQGRDIAFFGGPSIAKSETIQSIEGGIKANLAGNTLRFNGSVYYYTIEDQQLSAIGGGGNFVQLVNANEGTGIGFDVDAEWLVNENLVLTGGLSVVDTELDDANLVVPPCGSRLCTVEDPLDGNGNAILDGNSFVQAPEYIFTFTASYTHPWREGEAFFFTDWAFQGDTQFTLYEATEFFSGEQFEAGMKLGYRNTRNNWEIALFGRNITDEENVKGQIDFNNLTGFDNEPRVVGVSYRKNWR